MVHLFFTRKWMEQSEVKHILKIMKEILKLLFPFGCSPQWGLPQQENLQKRFGDYFPPDALPDVSWAQIQSIKITISDHQATTSSKSTTLEK